MASAELATRNGAAISAETLERVVVGGDLSKLSADQRLEFYRAKCESIGLDPVGQPFQYLSLQGKLTLYATKACTDQLCKLHRLSVAIASKEFDADSGIMSVTARVTFPDGRSVEDMGCVVVGNLKGEALANALMKAVTKAKRRTILSACGLGMLDETEVESIPGARTFVEAPPAIDNATGHGSGKYAKPEDVERYEAWADWFCQECEDRWADAVLQSTGELPTGENAFRASTLSLHLVRWGVQTKRLAHVDVEEIKLAQAPRFAAILFVRDSDATKEEAKVWAGQARHAANERLKSALPAPEREPGED
jgi:hypothetical protein